MFSPFGKEGASPSLPFCISIFLWFLARAYRSFGMGEKNS